MRKPDDADRKCPSPPSSARRCRTTRTADRRPARAVAGAGPVVEREAGQLRARSHPRAAHARQGSGAFGTFTVTHDITATPRAAIFRKWARNRDVRPLHHRGRRTRRGRRRARHPRLRLKFYTEEGNWDMVGNNTPVFFLRDPRKFPTSTRRSSATRAPTCVRPPTTGTSGRCCPEALHQVTIVMSDRGIPASYRHMHGFGSHTYSFWNAAGERFWVKFHFRTRQGIRNLSDAEAEGDRRQGPREPPARPVRGDRARDFPKWTMYVQVMPGSRCGKVPYHPFDPDQGMAAPGLPADRGRRVRTEPQSGELLRRRRAERVRAARQPGAGHRRVAGQDAAGAAVQLRRCAALPPRREPPPDPGQRRALPGAQQPARRSGRAADGNYGSRLHHEPNSFQQWQEQLQYREPPLKIDGNADWWNYREDDADYYQQPGDLFRLMTPAQQQALFDNTARAMGDAPEFIKRRPSTIAARPTRPMARAARRSAWGGSGGRARLRRAEAIHRLKALRQAPSRAGLCSLLTRRRLACRFLPIQSGKPHDQPDPGTRRATVRRAGATDRAALASAGTGAVRGFRRIAAVDGRARPQRQPAAGRAGAACRAAGPRRRRHHQRARLGAGRCDGRCRRRPGDDTLGRMLGHIFGGQQTQATQGLGGDRPRQRPDPDAAAHPRADRTRLPRQPHVRRATAAGVGAGGFRAAGFRPAGAGRRARPRGRTDRPAAGRTRRTARSGARRWRRRAGRIARRHPSAAAIAPDSIEPIHRIRNDKARSDAGFLQMRCGNNQAGSSSSGRSSKLQRSKPS